MKTGLASDDDAVRYRVTGMDCPSCVTKIEGAIRKLPGVEDVRVSLTTQTMTLEVDDQSARLPEVEKVVAALGYRLDRIRPKPVPGSGTVYDDDDHVQDYSDAAPSYRRALWIVVLLNAGYGLIEIVAGFLAGSQALKADALDFLGDGTITLLGLLAIGWSATWRARSALLQGLFLGALGLGVLATSAYHVLVLYQPEADMMGLFGLIALVVNLASAAVLLPHRTGDANVRAVWLFSRNDAIGNLAVVAAAGLVAWTGTAWPDLAVAVIVAGLFLQSSWSIIKDARTELRSARAGD